MLNSNLVLLFGCSNYILNVACMRRHAPDLREQSTNNDVMRKTVFTEESIVAAGESVVYKQYARTAKFSNA